MDKLRSCLRQLNCATDLITINKPMFRNDQLTNDIEIPSYAFFHNESKPSAEGVGVYFKQTLNTSINKKGYQFDDNEELFLSLQLQSRNLVLVVKWSPRLII